MCVIRIEGFVRSEESAIAHQMLDAFENRDQNVYNQAANRQHIGFLDNEVAKLARNIVVSGDLVSGGGYIDPSNPGSAPGGGGGGGGHGNFGQPPPPPPRGPYGNNSNNNSGYTPQQRPPASGGYTGGGARQQNHQQQDDRGEAWRALTGASAAPMPSPGQLEDDESLL